MNNIIKETNKQATKYINKLKRNAHRSYFLVLDFKYEPEQLKPICDMYRDTVGCLYCPLARKFRTDSGEVGFKCLYKILHNFANSRRAFYDVFYEEIKI